MTAQLPNKPSIARTASMPVLLFIVTAALATGTVLAVPLSIRLAHWCARTWGRAWVWLAGVRLEVRGLERLDPKRRYVFASNHQSGLDIPVLYAALQQYKLSFLSKRELLWVPFMGWGMSAIGHIGINRDDARSAHASVAKAVEKLRRSGNSLVLFPEGTRSPDGALQQFKTGAFRLAIDTGVDIVPVAISGASRVLTKNSSIYRPGKVTVSLGNPIPTQGATRADKQDLAQRVRSQVEQMLLTGDGLA
jgi:1-acyl-sn-glycerol-3-phosphate acyltransferase